MEDPQFERVARKMREARTDEEAEAARAELTALRECDEGPSRPRHNWSPSVHTVRDLKSPRSKRGIR